MEGVSPSGCPLGLHGQCCVAARGPACRDRDSEYLKLRAISVGLADLTSVLVRKMAFAFAFQNDPLAVFSVSCLWIMALLSWCVACWVALCHLNVQENILNPQEKNSQTRVGLMHT